MAPHIRLPVAHAAIVIVFVLLVGQTATADWSVMPRGSIALAAGAVTGIREFSGVTYLGPGAGGLERFAAVQDHGNQIVMFDVGVAADGTLTSATAVSKLAITPASDYEGIVFTGAARNTVYVSEETTPGVHEQSLVTGARLQSVALPGVYAKRRSNRGLESLARSVSGRVMWTANEEALSIDGPVATQAAGTVVRLQRIDDGGTSTSLGPSFAYQVKPIHAGSSPDRSGLSDMAMLPDDTLVTLERSYNPGGFPLFRSSIYQVNFAGATDIGGAAFNSGLVGKTYTPVGKTLLWSGAVGGIAGSGNNIEGLALGPSLTNGKWLLVGVADNAGIGPTMIVSFELALVGARLPGSGVLKQR